MRHLTGGSLSGLLYHLCIPSWKIDYMRNSLIDSGTINRSKKNTGQIVTGVLNSKRINVSEKTVDTSSLFLSGMTLRGS